MPENRKGRQSSIRNRLTISFILVSLIPLLLVGVVLAVQSFSVQREQALRFQQEVSSRVSVQVQAFVDRLQTQLTGVVKDLRNVPPDRQAVLLANLPAYPKVFQELTLLDATGKEKIKLSQLKVITPADLGDRSADAEFTVTRDTGQVYYGPVVFDKVTGEPSMSISAPMVNPVTGKVDGVLTSSVRFKEMWDLIASVEVTGGESVFIADAKGKIVAHLNPSVVLRDTQYTILADGIYMNGGFDVAHVVTASHTIELGDKKFNIVAEQDVYQALALAIQTVVITVVLLIVALLLASIQGFVVARQLTRPIQVLATAAAALSVKSENFDPNLLSIVVTRSDELGQLAQVFQDMGAKVIDREIVLKQQVIELRIEIDEAKKKKDVELITSSDAFKELEARAAEMRARARPRSQQPPKIVDPKPSSD